MADISKIQVPGSATQYNIKDAQARRDIEDVKADLGAQTGIISLEKNNYIDTSTTPISLTPKYSSVGRMYAVVDCVPGDKFVINAYSDYTQARAWCFIDNSNNAVSMADANVTVTDLELTAPANAVKLIINDMNDGMSYKVGNNLATKAGNGLNDDIKDAILGCLMNVAWGISDYENVFNELENAFNGDNFYNTYSFDLNNLVKVSGGCDVDYESLKDKLIKIDLGTGRKRRCFTVSRGRIPYLINLESSAYYPIPIPRNATKAIITWEPITQYFNCTTIGYIDNGQYKRISGSGAAWTTGGTIEIPLNEVGTTRALMINSKYDNAGTSYPVEPSKLNIKFEK